jgi:hypothetical protein
VADILTKLGGYSKTFADADDAETARALAVTAREAVHADAQVFVNGVRSVLKNALGKKSPALVNYGITPDKDPTPLTPDQEVKRVQKAKATRAARHTLGPKQKAKIKGQLPGGP